MRVLLDNVDTTSSSGPNSFGRQLVRSLVRQGIDVYDLIECMRKGVGIGVMPDVHLAFIQANIRGRTPLIQRLDGIYYNSDPQYGDWWTQNMGIHETYERASGVVFQSAFSRKLVEAFFGAKSIDRTTVIGNGVDLSMFDRIPVDTSFDLSKFDDVWMSASSWRPHKRLSENVRYFLEHSNANDVMLVAGAVDRNELIEHHRVMYIGECAHDKLISLYKRARYFVHLAYHDNCPNVVVDARAAGCHIICASCSGTPEIAGVGATVMIEDEWDPAPMLLYQPPALDFTRKQSNCIDSSIDIDDVARHYIEFMRRFI